MKLGGEVDAWFAFGILDDFDVLPRDLFAEAGAEGFDDGLFRSKSSGIVGNWILVPIAVEPLCFCKESV